MNESGALEGLIPSDKLSLADVPSHDSELEVLEAFCLTVDGYQNGRFSIEELLPEAERIECRGLEDATLDELRLAAFTRQRELRWTTYGDEVADGPLIWKLRRLAAEIRHRVSASPQTD